MCEMRCYGVREGGGPSLRPRKSVITISTKKGAEEPCKSEFDELKRRGRRHQKRKLSQPINWPFGVLAPEPCKARRQELLRQISTTDRTHARTGPDKQELLGSPAGPALTRASPRALCAGLGQHMKSTVQEFCQPQTTFHTADGRRRQFPQKLDLAPRITTQLARPPQRPRLAASRRTKTPQNPQIRQEPYLQEFLLSSHVHVHVP